MFKKQIGRNVEVYVDDMLVKSREEEDHLDDLRETLNTLRQYHMKLNPSKCAFGFPQGNFLGLSSHREELRQIPRKSGHPRNVLT